MKRIPLPHSPNGWFKVVFSDELAVGDVQRDPPVRPRPGRVPRRGRRRARARRVLPAPGRAPRRRRQGGRQRDPVPLPRLALRRRGRCTDVPYAKKIPALARDAVLGRCASRTATSWPGTTPRASRPTFEMPADSRVQRPRATTSTSACAGSSRRTSRRCTRTPSTSSTSRTCTRMQIEKVNWDGDGADRDARARPEARGGGAVERRGRDARSARSCTAPACR